MDAFRVLLVKEAWWLPLGLPLVPFIVLEMWGNWGWGDCTGVLGLSTQDDVEGVPPMGLPAFSLPESLSRSPLLCKPSRCWPPIFILLQVCRTRYFKGRGPFCQRKSERKPLLESLFLFPTPLAQLVQNLEGLLMYLPFSKCKCMLCPLVCSSPSKVLLHTWHQPNKRDEIKLHLTWHGSRKDYTIAVW